MATLHVFDYLDGRAEAAPVCVLFGDEPFLKRLAFRRLRRTVLGADDPPYTRFEGPAVPWRDVMDELATVSLFTTGRRLVVIDEADAFVTRHRARLEAYVERPKGTGVLVLDVATWAGTTRLYKSVANKGLQIDCSAPQKAVGRRKVLDEKRLEDWLASWCKAQHNARLEPAACTLLLELVGPEFGLLDQELAKLALFVEPGGRITAEVVQDVVGGWRTKTTWDLLDAACDGDAAEALAQLDRLLQSGANPVGLFGPIAWSLRRFAAATRIYQRAEQAGRRIGLRQALEQAGFRRWPPGALQRAERQLRQLGRERAGRLYRWLLEADLALKGTHSAPHRARFVMELLLVRLAKQLAKRPARR